MINSEMKRQISVKIELTSNCTECGVLDHVHYGKIAVNGIMRQVPICPECHNILGMKVESIQYVKAK